MLTRTIRRRSVPERDTLPADLHPLLRRVYAARGVRAAEELDLELTGLIPVGRLDGIGTAVELLCVHHARRSRIIVVGDFDADGATSTALVVRQLRRLGFQDVDFIVPNRFQYGYGLTPPIVQLAAQQQPGLIITVDNGISSHAGVDQARMLGIDILITDHHLPAATLPAANAIVNPNAQNGFPSKMLAGVGVAFYLMAALTREMQTRGRCLHPEPVADLLDLVALGTVADLVPLDRNNRILVYQGLRRIRAGRCLPGIRALLESANRLPESVLAADLGFQVGPRLNAAGRLDDMSIGIQCLLSDDAQTARQLAARLTQLNQDRRELERQMQQDAMASVANMRAEDPQLPLGMCLFDENWHQGVVGLVASRVKDKLHRPVIALARADADSLKGSARSVPGVHVRDVLEAVAVRHPELIEKFGGHAMAAGLTLPAQGLDRFREAFDAEVRRWMSIDQAVGIVHSDGALRSDELTLEIAQLLRESGPWGQGFPEPLFDGRFQVRRLRVLGGGRHLKLEVHDGLDACCEAIVFRHFDQEDAPQVQLGAWIELAYRLDVNHYGGTGRLQLIAEHLRILDDRSRTRTPRDLADEG
ncbi:ssDNA exonuclease RecJ [Steroidobacter denitrificans]|uniref:Single-stranded-DNA-specific exonuclease RecJ n=1 Tax=Steroidobacter denitrificans TaxID=465721 RepID=A0A127FA73_STEDE|nr:single-stranded-DNA-specific exonuclease RecJ [Steroidobacter denitrificans]AMN47317.1 ssDNA exonuclease RecJ [Steroidobacter denitrificans]